MPDQPQIPASLFPKSKAQLNREKYAAQLVADKAAVKKHRAERRLKCETIRPRWGSQEWAETRGDDLGLSPDC